MATATKTKQPKPESVAKARREGKTWNEVREQFGVKTSSGAFTKALNAAGFDAAGVKEGSSQKSKAVTRNGSGSKTTAKKAAKTTAKKAKAAKATTKTRRKASKASDPSPAA